jgi:hypothetical protein
VGIEGVRLCLEFSNGVIWAGVNEQEVRSSKGSVIGGRSGTVLQLRESAKIEGEGSRCESFEPAKKSQEKSESGSM